jgi:hypothetical protein
MCVWLSIFVPQKMHLAFVSSTFRVYYPIDRSAFNFIVCLFDSNAAVPPTTCCLLLKKREQIFPDFEFLFLSSTGIAEIIVLVIQIAYYGAGSLKSAR